MTLAGNATQVGGTLAYATLTSGGITYTADLAGAAGNSITIEIIAGGTAGSEVVTVVGTAIQVQIQSTVSTRTQVKTALDASAPAAALISVSVTSGGTAASLLAATPLASGADAPSFTMKAKDFTVSQTDTGTYKIALGDNFSSCLSCSILLQKATATDVMTEIISVDTSASAQAIFFRTIAGSTPVNLATGDVIYIIIILRNSGN